MTTQAPRPEVPQDPVPPEAPRPDQAALSVEDLARAILARQIKRPRITSVRRLAEALLGKKAKKARKKAAKKDKKVRKLAKIPGQKGQQGR